MPIPSNNSEDIRARYWADPWAKFHWSELKNRSVAGTSFSGISWPTQASMPDPSEGSRTRTTSSTSLPASGSVTSRDWSDLFNEWDHRLTRSTSSQSTSSYWWDIKAQHGYGLNDVSTNTPPDHQVREIKPEMEKGLLAGVFAKTLGEMAVASSISQRKRTPEEPMKPHVVYIQSVPNDGFLPELVNALAPAHTRRAELTTEDKAKVVKNWIEVGKFKQRIKACRKWRKQVKNLYSHRICQLKTDVDLLKNNISKEEAKKLKIKVRKEIKILEERRQAELEVIRKVSAGEIVVALSKDEDTLEEKREVKTTIPPQNQITPYETAKSNSCAAESNSESDSSVRSASSDEESKKPLRMKGGAPGRKRLEKERVKESNSGWKEEDFGSTTVKTAYEALENIDKKIRELGLSVNSRLEKTETYSLLTELAVARQATSDLSIALMKARGEVNLERSKVRNNGPSTRAPIELQTSIAAPVKRRLEIPSLPKKVSFASVVKDNIQSDGKVKIAGTPTDENEWKTNKEKGKINGNKTGTPKIVQVVSKVPKTIKKVSPPMDMSRTVVLSPVDESSIKSLDLLREVLLRQLKPLIKNIEVVGMRSKMKGIAYALECSSSEDRDKLLQHDGLVGLGLKATLPTKPGEAIEIVGIHQDITPEVILNELWEKNLSQYYNKEEFEGKVSLRYNIPCGWIQGGKFVRWVVELPVEIKERLLGIGYVRIEWSRLTIRNHIWTARCWRCLRMGHHKFQCKKVASACTHCSAIGHWKKECPKINEGPICLPCKERGHPFKHRITDTECPEYKKEVEHQAANRASET